MGFCFRMAALVVHLVSDFQNIRNTTHTNLVVGLVMIYFFLVKSLFFLEFSGRATQKKLPFYFVLGIQYLDHMRGPRHL